MRFPANSGVVETFGYVFRAVGRYNTDVLSVFIVQGVTILVAPALFAASIYMTLGRLIQSIGAERHSLIRVNWLTKAFVICDVFSFIVQSSGGSLLAIEDFDPATAEGIVLAGLFIQIVAFGLFAVVAALFHRRVLRDPTPASKDPKSPWVRIMWMLYAVSALIMVRSIFRVIEYILGTGSYLLTNEWPLYVFDAALMFLTVVVFGWWYPGQLKPARERADWDRMEGAAPGMGAGSDNYPLTDSSNGVRK